MELVLFRFKKWQEQFIDCDDTNFDIHPDAEEICNDIDEDCNGLADEVAVDISPTGVINLCNGETVTLTATDGYPNYEWYKNGNPIPVFTSSVTVDNPGYYQVYVSDGTCSALSEEQAVAVSEMPNANIYAPEGADLCFDDSIKLKASYGELYSWQWYRNGSPVVDEINYKMAATIKGTYYCVISTVLGCTRTTADLEVIASCREGLNSVNSDLTVYPNPAKDMISFNFETGTNNSLAAELIIVNVNGEEVIAIPVQISNGLLNISMDISKLSNGIYFAKLNSSVDQYSTQFTVVK